jgi:hypothetical protein
MRVIEHDTGKGQYFHPYREHFPHYQEMALLGKGYILRELVSNALMLSASLKSGCHG